MRLPVRDEALEALQHDTYDVLVIGGGITGAGVAMDAAARGLRVALVERRDYASGTSRWSTKLVHGGIRYLPQLDIGLVHEALVERGLLLRNAPRLVEPLLFVLPLYRFLLVPPGRLRIEALDERSQIFYYLVAQCSATREKVQQCVCRSAMRRWKRCNTTPTMCS
ncbi:Aerobic glycerol-3-phosphate dehydrogenase [bacterium HR27]|nr:Aerobic glycerol-3-phosphate dehydrogenase [bacterium HR27]